MIEELKNTEIKHKTGRIYDFMLEDIKILYKTYPDLARELAISILEDAFTDEISSDNYWICAKIEQYKHSTNK